MSFLLICPFMHTVRLSFDDNAHVLASIDKKIRKQINKLRKKFINSSGVQSIK